MSQILVCPYCNKKMEIKGNKNTTSWVECECGGLFSLEEGIPESEKRKIAIEKEQKENELREREKKRKQDEHLRMEQETYERIKRQKTAESVEWIKNNDAHAIFYENLICKIIAQNEELIELNKAQVALLNRIAMKPSSSGYVYQTPATSTPSAPTYGPDEYLRDQMICEREGKHSATGYAAYRRMRDYEMGS